MIDVNTVNAFFSWQFWAFFGIVLEIFGFVLMTFLWGKHPKMEQYLKWIDAHEAVVSEWRAGMTLVRMQKAKESKKWYTMLPWSYMYIDDVQKDKTERNIKLVAYLANYTNADKNNCEHAAKLSKCDLVSETVSEFPKLQGIIGRNIAFLNNENEEICTAIEEQYLPKQSGGKLPTTPVGITLALADRLDTLVGIFAIGKKPTGLKDPYGLRRAALAVLRIIIETPLNIDLSKCLEKAATFFPDKLNADKAVGDVQEYINERYRAYFSDRDIPVDVIDSVLANHPTHPSDVAAKIDALMSFRKLPNAESLAAANKRIRNILKKIDRDNIGEVDISLFKENAESTLHSALVSLSGDVENLFKDNKYEQALNKLADLRQPVDSFFDDVMVMDKDKKLKANRIALLSRIDSLFMHVADFSRLQS